MKMLKEIMWEALFSLMAIVLVVIVALLLFGGKSKSSLAKTVTSKAVPTVMNSHQVK